MAWISTSVLFYAYSKLYILTELSANDVKITSVDRQKLDLSKYIYLWYRKFYICRDTARFYEHKKWPSYFFIKALLVPLKWTSHISLERHYYGYPTCYLFAKVKILRDWKPWYYRNFAKQNLFKCKMDSSILIVLKCNIHWKGLIVYSL